MQMPALYLQIYNEMLRMVADISTIGYLISNCSL